jgi:hypothetical protein
MVLTSCSYEAAVQRLAPAEQAEFRAYQKIMTAPQAHTYLAKATAAERTAYAHELGLAQRLQALAAPDREAVLAGYSRKGMSTEAMRFLWGEPYPQQGYTNHYEHWYYLGSSLSPPSATSPITLAPGWMPTSRRDGWSGGWISSPASTMPAVTVRAVSGQELIAYA